MNELKDLKALCHKQQVKIDTLEAAAINAEKRDINISAYHKKDIQVLHNTLEFVLSVTSVDKEDLQAVIRLIETKAELDNLGAVK